MLPVSIGLWLLVNSLRSTGTGFLDADFLPVVGHLVKDSGNAKARNLTAFGLKHGHDVGRREFVAGHLIDGIADPLGLSVLGTAGRPFLYNRRPVCVNRCFGWERLVLANGQRDAQSAQLALDAFTLAFKFVDAIQNLCFCAVHTPTKP